MAIARAIPAPSMKAPITVPKMGMAAQQAERDALRDAWLAREAAKGAVIKVDGAGSIKVEKAAPKPEAPRPVQRPLLGCPSTGIESAPAFKAHGFTARPEAIAVMVGRVDLGTARMVYGDQSARDWRIVNAVVDGVSPDDAATREDRAGDIMLGIVYDTSREDTPSAKCAPKLRAAMARIGEAKADMPWLCSYNEHDFTTTSEDEIMNVIRELMASSRVQSVSVAEGGFVQEADGQWAYRKTKGQRKLTRVQWTTAFRTPTGDAPVRTSSGRLTAGAKPVSNRANFNRYDGWQKAGNSRVTFSGG